MCQPLFMMLDYYGMLSVCRDTHNPDFLAMNMSIRYVGQGLEVHFLVNLESHLCLSGLTFRDVGEGG